jgi:tRNA(Ile)-lysidine synthase
MDVVLPKPGRYVVAVSGGVDSVVLLDILHKQPDLDLIVAHFDHGIREDSAEDRKFVHELAHTHGLNFAYAEGQLGAKASEALAREHRYVFLRSVQKNNKAAAIITAHHLDDVLETAILNMLRGTGRKGLTSLQDRADIKRPLLKVPKSEIVDYATKHRLEWHEDPTNSNTDYLRNYVRHKILPRFKVSGRSELVSILTNSEVTNRELDGLLAQILQAQNGQNRLDRQSFNNLPHEVARELMAAWLRQNKAGGFDRKGLERLVVAAKTAQPQRRHDVSQGVSMVVHKDYLALAKPER